MAHVPSRSIRCIHCTEHSRTRPSAPQVEVPKPSEGLEYTYARKPSQYDHEKKDLAHIWEVSPQARFAATNDLYTHTHTHTFPHTHTHKYPHSLQYVMSHMWKAVLHAAA